MGHSLLLLLLCLCGAAVAAVDAGKSYGIVVYGATPSGVMAAVAAARLGTSALLVNPVGRIGGMCSGGLSRTDVGHDPDSVIGGLAREFFMRNAKHYNASATTPEYMLEPHVAEQIFTTMLTEAGVDIVSNQTVASVQTRKEASSMVTILSWTSSSGVVYTGDTFVDASYEGDLLARAGVSYTVGREGIAKYNESYAGRRYYSPKNQFYVRVDPYFEDGSLLPLVYGGPATQPGHGDSKVTAYNFRLCVTTNTSNQLAWTKPARYNASQYELFRRYAKLVPPALHSFISNIAPTINDKRDLNNGGPLSTDFIGANWAYPDADYADRQAIWQAHMDYTQGLLWFLASDESLDPKVHEETRAYGRCKDEFVDTDGWPHQLYVREARRMVGPAVFTQNDATAHIGVGGYNFDSHNVQRLPCASDTVHCEPTNSSGGDSVQGAYALDEGDLEVWPGYFEIPHTVLLPDATQASNLVVSVAVSASHVGYSSLRLEPQYMIMGHAAGTLCSLAASGSSGVLTKVPLSLLTSTLAKQHQILVAPPQPE